MGESANVEELLHRVRSSLSSRSSGPPLPSSLPSQGLSELLPPRTRSSPIEERRAKYLAEWDALGSSASPHAPRSNRYEQHNLGFGSLSLTDALSSPLSSPSLADAPSSPSPNVVTPARQRRRPPPAVPSHPSPRTPDEGDIWTSASRPSPPSNAMGSSSRAVQAVRMASAASRTDHARAAAYRILSSPPLSLGERARRTTELRNAERIARQQDLLAARAQQEQLLYSSPSSMPFPSYTSVYASASPPPSSPPAPSVKPPNQNLLPFLSFPKLTADLADGGCVICLEPFVSQARGIRCGHVFHEACISAWLDVNETCPTCRCPIFESG